MVFGLRKSEFFANFFVNSIPMTILEQIKSEKSFKKNFSYRLTFLSIIDLRFDDISLMEQKLF